MLGSDLDTFGGQLSRWEQSLGQLLRFALEHIEAVQTTDLAQLFQHAATVLHGAQRAHEQQLAIDFEKTQPSLVLRYLSSVLTRLETIGEEKMMPHVQDNELMLAVTRHLHTFHNRLSHDDLLCGATCLAMATNTDAYDTHPTAFLNADAQTLLRDFPQLFLTAMASDSAARKQLRPLLDVIQRF